MTSLRLHPAGHLLDLDDDELGGLERSEADEDVDDAEVDVILGRGLSVALDEVSLSRRAPLKGALAEEVLHEGADVQPYLSPQRLVVRLEDHPLQVAIQGLLEEQGEPPHGDVLPLRGQTVGAVEGPRSPDHVPDDREGSQAVDPYGV